MVHARMHYALVRLILQAKHQGSSDTRACEVGSSIRVRNMYGRMAYAWYGLASHQPPPAPSVRSASASVDQHCGEDKTITDWNPSACVSSVRGKVCHWFGKANVGATVLRCVWDHVMAVPEYAIDGPAAFCTLKPAHPHPHPLTPSHTHSPTLHTQTRLRTIPSQPANAAQPSILHDYPGVVPHPRFLEMSRATVRSRDLGTEIAR